MKKQKTIVFSVTLDKGTGDSKTSLFVAKAERLLNIYCAGTKVFFKRNKGLMVSGIRTANGLLLVKAVLATLAEGMELTLNDIDFGVTDVR